MELRDTVDVKPDPTFEKASGVVGGNYTVDVKPDRTVENECGIGKVNDIYY
jgi:hypothetical protein